MWHEVAVKISPRASTTGTPSNDAELAASLAKLWPHRWHESNWLKNLFCHFGLHNWQQLYLDEAGS